MKNHEGECVAQKDCSCIHDDQLLSPNERSSTDKETCVCINGKILCNQIESAQQNCLQIGMIPAGNTISTCEDYAVGFKISNSTCSCPDDLLKWLQIYYKNATHIYIYIVYILYYFV